MLKIQTRPLLPPCLSSTATVNNKQGDQGERQRRGREDQEAIARRSWTGAGAGAQRGHQRGYRAVPWPWAADTSAPPAFLRRKGYGLV